ncbi:WG repeat-containing protein [Dokdonia sinensis]|uniref:WG repeat-containing protein n=1 Tax=Dokdonia sinensis TaxID=2479847 RepID=A0A3M0GN23_9FLAO|nr:WG repeat-containing protein [Dokdonia sinensis]RMB64132.1 WG repeat-containing protein [Dokdonia sinensis]
MKNILILIAIAVTALQSHSQEIKKADFISPFHNGLAAVKKGDTWGFIDEKGMLVINYRDDLVAQPCEKHPEWSFPKFVQGRTLIKKTMDNIIYYGFIDTQGNVVLEPTFINATHYNTYGLAIIQRLVKDTYGSNQIMKKNIVRYTYTEEAINLNGATVAYLTEPKHILPYQDRMKTSPKLQSILLSKDWVAAHNKDNTYNLIRIEPLKK